jgi:hypothetical protein
VSRAGRERAEAVAVSKTGEFSWQHKYKSTDSDRAESYGDLKSQLPERTRRYVETEDRKSRRPITAYGDVELRRECLNNRLEARRWSTVTFAYKKWLEGYTDNDGALVFEDDDGERTTVEPTVRFNPTGSKREYSRLSDLERGLREKWGNALTTVMLSLTSSSRNARGGWRCPGDHLREHTGSWGAVRESISRALEGREYVTARVLEAHKSGYAHTHVAIFVRGSVNRADLASCVDAHLRNCPGAERSAHIPSECIDVRDVGDERKDGEQIRNLSAYLSAYMADSFDEPDERPEHVRRFNALLWATNTRRVSYSQNAYDFMEIGRREREDEVFVEDVETLHLLGYSPSGDPHGSIQEIERDHEKRESTTTATAQGLALPEIVDPPPD